MEATYFDESRRSNKDMVNVLFFAGFYENYSLKEQVLVKKGGIAKREAEMQRTLFTVIKI